MNKSRKIKGLIALLAVALTLAACGGNSHQLCFSYNGQTKCMSAAKLQDLRKAVKRANKAIASFNQNVAAQP